MQPRPCADRRSKRNQPRRHGSNAPILLLPMTKRVLQVQPALPVRLVRAALPVQAVLQAPAVPRPASSTYESAPPAETRGAATGVVGCVLHARSQVLLFALCQCKHGVGSPLLPPIATPAISRRKTRSDLKLFLIAIRCLTASGPCLHLVIPVVHASHPSFRKSGPNRNFSDVEMGKFAALHIGRQTWPSPPHKISH